MKSGKSIDVSKSSLVSLKAELVRKQEEAQKSKGSESYVRPQPKKKKEIKVNPGIEERKQKDELAEEEVDLLMKSREVLEVKSKLYDKLQTGKSVQEDIGDSYLVDFKEKVDKVFSEAASTSKQNLDEPVDDEPINEDDYDDDGWVDYTDCLGRTRRCLKEDLEIIKEKDKEMSKMLGAGSSAKDSSQSVIDEDETGESKLEMITADMERQKMREKWEQQEQLLLDKKNIYYEDIRFDEARSHGVAYYSFSTDESKREEEQAEFKRIRDETLAKQKEAKQAKERRDMLKQNRLMAARNRQRARLGLPPLSTDIEMEETKEETKEIEEGDQGESTKELENALARAAHVRPWDIGKDGVKQPDKVMTQEEWIEKKRLERPEEFAPLHEESESDIGPPVPLSFTHTVKPSSSDELKQNPQRTKFLKSLKRKEDFQDAFSKKKYDRTTTENVSESHWIPSTSSQSIGPSTSSGNPSRVRAEIPPPPTFDYYNISRKSKEKTSKGKSSKEMIESIEAGLEFLKKQSEERDKKVKDVVE